MQFDSLVIDPFAFTGPGTITGEHRHLTDIAATKLKAVDDADNNIEYKENLIQVSKGLTVLGPLVAPNIGNNGVYPADPAFQSINVTGQSNCHGGINTARIFQSDAPVSMELDAGSLRMKAHGNSLLAIAPDKTTFHNKLDFSNLTEADIIDWPGAAIGIEATNDGIKVVHPDDDSKIGTIEAGHCDFTSVSVGGIMETHAFLADRDVAV